MSEASVLGTNPNILIPDLIKIPSNSVSHLLASDECSTTTQTLQKISEAEGS